MPEQTVKILIVDDSETNRELLSMRLKTYGYHLQCVKDGYQALEFLENDSVDIILLDIMMPGLSGIDVLKIIRKTKSALELPIIMVTAKMESSDVIEALDCGANDYVTKPIDFPVIRARIRMQLELKRLATFREEFMSIATHDLKKPLALMVEVTEQLQEDIEDGTADIADVKEMLYLISRSGRDVQKLVYEFLDFQAVNAGSLTINTKEARLNDITKKIINKHIYNANSKKIKLALDLPDDSLMVKLDVERYEQVLDNYLDNAIKFSAADSIATIKARKEGNQILVEIIDQGPGLTDDDMKKVFSKYARLSNKPTANETSTGLGLAICKKIIQYMDGDVGVRNNEQVGATFWFRLPTL